MTPLLLACLLAPDVDLSLTVDDPSVTVGCEIEIDLFLSTDEATGVVGADAILSWDPNALELIEAVPDPAWFVGAFLNDPDGLNDDVTDGAALFTVLSNPSSPESIDGNRLAATFRFKVLGDGDLALEPAMGIFGETAVYGVQPGADLTGTLSPDLPITGIDVIAVEAVRLGFPANPSALQQGVTSGPIINQTWDPRIDHTTFLPDALLDTFVLTPNIGPPVNIPSPFGTILINLAAMPLIQDFATPGEVFPFPIPCQCNLVGLEFCAQGASISATQIQATNALDIVIGTI
ncbi:MAG: cohesin domain-containing protein [Planctomycetota bacterium]